MGLRDWWTGLWRRFRQADVVERLDEQLDEQIRCRCEWQAIAERAIADLETEYRWLAARAGPVA